MPRCRDCKLYDLDAVKNARGAVMGNKAAKCNWRYGAIPVSILGKSRPPEPSYMEPNKIHSCATFVQRTEND